MTSKKPSNNDMTIGYHQPPLRGGNNEELANNAHRVITIQKSPMIPLFFIPYMIGEKGIVSSMTSVGDDGNNDGNAGYGMMKGKI
jgi:hypothetical protein